MGKWSDPKAAFLCECGEHAWKPITKGFVVFVSPEDIEILRQRWRAQTTRKADLVYCVSGRGVILHRILLPGSDYVDHRDANGLNNRRSNIRPCTNQQNTGWARKAKGTSSKYRGVYYSASRREWRASTRVNGVFIHIGWFKSEDDAAMAYNRVASDVYGEFARLNIVQK